MIEHPHPTHRLRVLPGGIALISILLCASWAGAQAKNVCSSYGTSVLVIGNVSELHLCRAHQSIADYDVAMGLNGLGKEKVGDRKTPLGTFRLLKPRRSYSGFKTFIGIAVPRKMGIAVGIHGPSRVGRWVGRLSTLFDWTLGCIALPYDNDIEEIARFVRAHPKAPIHIVQNL